MKLADREICQCYAIGISEVDHRILAAYRRLKQGLRLAGLSLAQQRRQLDEVGERRKSIELNDRGVWGIGDDLRAET